MIIYAFNLLWRSRTRYGNLFIGASPGSRDRVLSDSGSVCEKFYHYSYSYTLEVGYYQTLYGQYDAQHCWPVQLMFSLQLAKLLCRAHYWLILSACCPLPGLTHLFRYVNQKHEATHQKKCHTLTPIWVIGLQKTRTLGGRLFFKCALKPCFIKMAQIMDMFFQFLKEAEYPVCCKDNEEDVCSDNLTVTNGVHGNSLE